MQAQFYQPFKRMIFDHSICFLTGQKLLSKDETLNVFAPWLSEQYKLNERPFKMLDESMVSYADIKVPCSEFATQKIYDLEAKIENAFSKGYKGVLELEEIEIFQWAAKTIYGVIFKEIQSAIKQQLAGGEPFNMSQGLIHKFTNLHNMLQSIVKPVQFDSFKPWSIFICNVDNLEDEFAYRDEVNTLTFSLRMKDFGIIVCLQDNGANKKYQEEIWNKIKDQKLHPIQFEELCGKVFYSAYLFNRLPEYHTMQVGEEITMEAMPLRGMISKPVFDLWQNKTYGQVLENFWKRWEFLLLEIIKNPESPMSFLFDDQENFIEAESIKLSK
jgi:hypothetical protein